MSITHISKFDELPTFVTNLEKNIKIESPGGMTTTGIYYIGQSGTSGYANAAKGYILDYLNRGIPITFKTFDCDESRNIEISYFDKLINGTKTNTNPYDTIIVHSTPDIWDALLVEFAGDLTGKTLIGRTVWEFEKLIPQWVECINKSKVDVVSVPTEWTRIAFKGSGVKKKIVVDPHIYVDVPYKHFPLEHFVSEKSVMFYEGDPNKLDFSKLYKFYTIGQMIPRKGISETIEAFCKAFTKKDKVALFVKTFRSSYDKEEVKLCSEHLNQIIKLHSPKGNHAPILYVKDSLTHDELNSLHDVCDCYAQLARSEGFGLGMFDAHNRGKPLIVPDYGGQCEYLKEGYDGLVDYTTGPIGESESVFFQFTLDSSYTWAHASIPHAVKLMQKRARE